MLTKRVKSILIEHNGILTLDQAVENGLTKESIRKAHLRGDLVKLEGGIYLLDNSYSDELYTTQLRFSKGVYSHETAVMLHSLTTYSPFDYHLTFPRGYHLINPEKNYIYPHHISVDKFNIGVVKMDSWHGNPIFVTDLERTVIDMMNNRKAFPGIVDEMINNYFWTEDKNIDKLKKYANAFGVQKEVEAKVINLVK